MDLPGFQKQLKELVANDRLSDALKALITFSQNEEGYDEMEKGAIINQGKLDRIEREKTEDTISAEDYAVTRTQISASVLTLLEEFDKGAPIVIPSSNKSTTNTTTSTDQQQQIQAIIMGNDKIFMTIILGVLAVSVCLFTFFIFQNNYGGAGAFFTSSAGTCFIYLNNKKQMLKTLQAAA